MMKRIVYIYTSTGACTRAEGKNEEELKKNIRDAVKELRESLDY
jgi:hypothetical protein